MAALSTATADRSPSRTMGRRHWRPAMTEFRGAAVDAQGGGDALDRGLAAGQEQQHQLPHAFLRLARPFVHRLFGSPKGCWSADM
jgi:hypothetical protein